MFQSRQSLLISHWLVTRQNVPITSILTEFPLAWYLPKCANHVCPYWFHTGLLPAKMCQSRLSLLISHWFFDRILMSAFPWLAQKKWYGKSLSSPVLNFSLLIAVYCISQWRRSWKLNETSWMEQIYPNTVELLCRKKKTRPSPSNQFSWCPTADRILQS